MEATGTAPDMLHRIGIQPDTVGCMGIKLHWATTVEIVEQKEQVTRMVPPEKTLWGEYME